MKLINKPSILALSAALTLPLMAAEPLPSEAANRLPVFSWDRVPQYMHIRKGDKFTEDEIKYLATFPLVTFEKTTGSQTFKSTEDGTLAAAKAVKEINPSTKILYYRNVFVHYGTYKANAEIDKMPGAFLVGREGKTKLIRNVCEAYDLSNPQVREWWVGNAKQMCADPAIDGLFLDGMIKIYSGGYLMRDIGKEKKEAVLRDFEGMMRETRQAIGPDKIMLANVLRTGQSKDDGLEAIKLFDGSYIEGFEIAANPEQKKNNVARGMVAFQKAAREGFMIAFTAGLSEMNTEEGNLNPEKTDENRKGRGKNANPSRNSSAPWVRQKAPQFKRVTSTPANSPTPRCAWISRTRSAKSNGSSRRRSKEFYEPQPERREPWRKSNRRLARRAK